MESLCVVVRENAGELVASTKLSRDAKCGKAAAGVGRGFSTPPQVLLDQTQRDEHQQSHVVEHNVEHAHLRET